MKTTISSTPQIVYVKNTGDARNDNCNSGSVTLSLLDPTMLFMAEQFLLCRVLSGQVGEEVTQQGLPGFVTARSLHRPHSAGPTVCPSPVRLPRYVPIAHPLSVERLSDRQLLD